MKEEEIINEKFFQEIMSKSKLELPFSDFEDQVMVQIEKKVLQKLPFLKEMKLSWISFIVGSAFGISISLLLPQINKPILGFQPGTITMLFQVVFTLLLFTQIDILIRFIDSKESKK